MLRRFSVVHFSYFVKNDTTDLTITPLRCTFMVLLLNLSQNWALNLSQNQRTNFHVVWKVFPTLTVTKLKRLQFYVTNRSLAGSKRAIYFIYGPQDRFKIIWIFQSCRMDGLKLFARLINVSLYFPVRQFQSLHEKRGWVLKYTLTYNLTPQLRLIDSTERGALFAMFSKYWVRFHCYCADKITDGISLWSTTWLLGPWYLVRSIP